MGDHGADQQAVHELGLDPRADTRAQAERTATMPFIHPHLALMPDAHLGKGATVGSVIPTLGAIMPAAVGRRHRLRHDRGPHPVHRRRAAGATGARCARRSRRAVPLSAGQVQRRASRRRHTEARIAELERCARIDAGSTRRRTPATGGCSSAPSGSGNHFIEVSRRRAGPGLAVPALRLARCRQQDRARTTSRSPSSSARAGASSCPTATWPTWSRAPTSSAAYIARAALGAAVRAAQPRGDDGPRRRLLRATGSASRRRAGADQLPPQLHAPGAALRQATCGCPARARSTRPRAARADPRVDGHRSLRRHRQGQPRCR